MGVSAKRRIARQRRAARVRKKVSGSDTVPRLSVFRSNRYLYVQVISDQSGRTLAAASTLKASAKPDVTAAKALGKEIAEKCKSLSISEVIFDRGGYRYHGRVRAIAESAREAGLKL